MIDLGYDSTSLYDKYRTKSEEVNKQKKKLIFSKLRAKRKSKAKNGKRK